MASLWSQRQGEKSPTKVVGHLPQNTAIMLFHAMISDATLKGWTVKQDGLDALVLHPITGAVLGSLYVEPVSQPSVPTWPDTLSIIASERTG